jgi:hypothetical protein
MFDTRDRERRGMMILGTALILLGGLALVLRALSVDVFDLGWPLLVLVPGILLFAVAVAVGGRPGVAFAIPAGIVTMAGLVLSFQAATGLWATWAYVWALVAPGGVGVGMAVYGLVTRQPEFVRAGTPILATGLGLFLAFGLFFEGVLGLSGPAVAGIEPILATGLVAVGLILVVSGVIRRRDPAG